MAERYRPITVRRIVMERDLDYASKLDRSAAFIREMQAYGEAKAHRCLEEWEAAVPVSEQ